MAKTAVDELDRRIAELLQERAAAALGRGSEVQPLSPDTLRAIFRELDGGVRQAQRSTTVAFLGPLYSYSHQAVIERFGQAASLAPVQSIAAVFEEVGRGQSDYGVVPIENSTDGRVVDTLGLFPRHQARICGDVQLRIHHCLWARCERIAVREVHSKPQALSQCRTWLTTHLPHARLVEAPSTAAAAGLAAERHDVAAVAGRPAGVSFGLDLLAENIEDNPHNITRFAVLAAAPASRTGQDKTAVMFQVRHQPGALADAMTVFKTQRLNLTWIESFPIPGAEKAYRFFVELEGHAADEPVRAAIEELTPLTLQLEILGSYAKSEPVG